LEKFNFLLRILGQLELLEETLLEDNFKYYFYLNITMVYHELIKVDSKTKKLLDELKLVKEEHYNTVINRLILTSSLTGGTL
jgi:hypothetical protein